MSTLVLMCIAWHAICRSVGKVTTEYHTVSLKVKSVLDECGGGYTEADANEFKDCVYSMQHSTTVSASLDLSHEDDNCNKVDMEQQRTLGTTPAAKEAKARMSNGHHLKEHSNVAIDAALINMSDTLSDPFMDPRKIVQRKFCLGNKHPVQWLACIFYATWMSFNSGHLICSYVSSLLCLFWRPWIVPSNDLYTS